MATSTLLNLVAMTVSSAFGTSSTIPLGTAATINSVTYLSFANAGATGGIQVSYSILDTGNSETGTATYNSSNTTLTNRTPTQSTNGSTFINASSAALVYAVARAQDIIPFAAPLTNSLVADVALSSAGSYSDGPSVAQGSTGIWFASGNLVLTDTAGAGAFFYKLWDGTTVIDSGSVNTGGVGFRGPVAVSGPFTNPAGNIRISAASVSGSTGGGMRFNNSGNSKDSTITVFRIG